MHAKPLAMSIVAFVALLTSVSSLTVAVENNNPPFHNECSAGRPAEQMTRESLNRLDDEQREPMKSTDAVMHPSFVIYNFDNFEPGSSCRDTCVGVAMPEKKSNACNDERLGTIIGAIQTEAHPPLATNDLVKEAPLEEYGGGEPIDLSCRMARTFGDFKTSNIDTLQGFTKCNPSLIHTMDRKKKNVGTIERPRAIDVTTAVVQHDQRRVSPLEIRPPTTGLGVSQPSAEPSRKLNPRCLPTKLRPRHFNMCHSTDNLFFFFFGYVFFRIPAFRPYGTRAMRTAIVDGRPYLPQTNV